MHNTQKHIGYVRSMMRGRELALDLTKNIKRYLNSQLGRDKLIAADGYEALQAAFKPKQDAAIFKFSPKSEKWVKQWVMNGLKDSY